MRHIFTLMGGFEKPEVIVKKQMLPQIVTLWCGLSAGGTIGLYIFVKEASLTVNFTATWYRVMITKFFYPKSDNIDVANIWFPRDGATYHTARETLYLLHEIFRGHVLSFWSELAPQIKWFDAIRFLFKGPFKSTGLLYQAHNHAHFNAEDYVKP